MTRITDTAAACTHAGADGPSRRGTATGRDALARVRAGASGVAVGAVLFNDPFEPLRIRDEPRAALAVRGIGAFEAAVGLAHRAL
ncbi:hypothetical protein ABZY57_31775 [Streptomyces sp. NPDC006450]|uniref:hypothetical protein n=1 Tax=Streptomyces sp. NPDC006450 TaxID=3155458 RepID=UPI0033A392D8